MRISLLICCLFLSIKPFAQNNTNIWYFGEYAGIDFNSGAPVALTNSEMNTLEGCATICNGEGELLFYTDGSTVWNMNHEVMVNGTGLFGDSSSAQSSIIVPTPGSDDTYYIFTTVSSSEGLRYSIVDMSLSGGVGAVTADKNILLASGMTEKLTATLHANQEDFWIIAHEWGNNNYLAFLLTSTGIETVPVVSSVGEALTFGGYPMQHAVGCIKVNYQGTQLASANYFDDGTFELFDFDNSSGELTLVSTSSTFYRPFGVEFSPDGNLLYGTTDNEEYTNGRVYQFDLTSADPLSTAVQVGSSTNHSSGVQLGPDQKIYVTINSDEYLGVINNPNEEGDDCDFVHDGFFLEGGIGWRGLPQLQVYEYFDFSEVFDQDSLFMCHGDSVELQTMIGNADSYLWSNGEITSDIYITEPGTYWVEVETGGQVHSDSILVSEIIPELELGPDQQICPEESAWVEASGSFDSIEWFDGSSSTDQEFLSSGTYSAEAELQGCFTSDSINIVVQEIPEAELETEYFLCSSNDSVAVNPGLPEGSQYSWSSGSTEAIGVFHDAGDYWLEIQQGDCSTTSEFSIVTVPNNLMLSSDTNLCEGSSVDIELINSSWEGEWSDGSTGNSLTVDDEGVYEVQVVFGECEIEDEIIVVEIENPDVLIEDQTICPSGSFSFSIPVQNEGVWLNGSQIGSQFTVNSPADYELTLQIEQCQFSSGFSVQHLSDTLSLKSHYPLCEEDTLILTVQPENNPVWPGNVTTPEYAITQPGDYTVDFEMFGCDFSREVQVNETLLCPCDHPVFIPNAFSADNDGINDRFRPEIYCALADYHLRIYNRWGEIVFESKDPDLTWNGSHNQGDYYVENEVYHYVLKIRRLIAVDDEVYKGHITVFR